MDYRDPISINLPNSDDEFERLCMLVARERYGPEFYRYGRRGQAQNGIDIYSAYYDGRCLQCKLHKKNITDSKLLFELTKDLKKAKQKFHGLKQFIFATSVETRPDIQLECEQLSVEYNLNIIPWFWNQIQEDIACSKWLLRYYLDFTSGAQWVSDDFAEQELKKGKELDWHPLQFYSSNNIVQWYGLLQKWDAPRQQYSGICQSIASSFDDIYSDMPVAAVVRGDGGSGKSVLLRRIALDLRSQYTVYWIADNAEDFINNEWVYDIDNNSTEKYLLIVEDWYRNFASTEDRSTANRLLQKVKSKTNVRLLIGDRHSQSTYYPKINQAIYDLRSKENGKLLEYISNIVPEWENKFQETEQEKLLKTGLFQILFVYQYADTANTLNRAENYFLEVVQSDFKHLVKSDKQFYKGLAHALYVYANLYTDFALTLSPEAVIVLAEFYSGSKRPIKLKQNSLALVDDPIIHRYLNVIVKNSQGKEYFIVRFLHDTLADEGWKNVIVDKRDAFDFNHSIIEILNSLRSQKTNNDLSKVIYRITQVNCGLLSKEQIISICGHLIDSHCESPLYVCILFDEKLLEITDEVRISFIDRLVGFGNERSGIWAPITDWIKNNLTVKEQLSIFRKIVGGGNICQSVLTNYYRLLDEPELKQFVISDFNLDKMKDPYYTELTTVILDRIGSDADVLIIVRNYLKSLEYRWDNNVFPKCLKLIKGEDVAKTAAQNYLQSPSPENTVENFCACLKVLDLEASKVIVDILNSDIENYHHTIVYGSLAVVGNNNNPELNNAAENAVAKIINEKPKHYDEKEFERFYVYLQMMKIPLFRVSAWCNEVNNLLDGFEYIHRNLFYSLTLSHTDNPEPLAEPCLYFIRNWKNEFGRSKKYWGYLVRSLAHPIIQEQAYLKSEVQLLAIDMLHAKNCPPKLKNWLSSIVHNGVFPQWKRLEEPTSLVIGKSSS